MAAPQPSDSRLPSTRDRLIQTTAQHLARLGPRGVELRAICIELGISPSLVNYHFSTTGELLWLAAVHGYQHHVDEQYRAVSTAPDGPTALERWLRGTIEWKRDATGIAAVIDYPMLAFADEDAGDVEEHAKRISELSRRNVAVLGSSVLAVMTGRRVRMLSSQRVALLIKANRDFAFWISTVGFGGQGAATWIAGRRPYSPLWKMFGFSPDKQVRSTIAGLIQRIGSTTATDLPSDQELDEPS